MTRTPRGGVGAVVVVPPEHTPKLSSSGVVEAPERHSILPVLHPHVGNSAHSSPHVAPEQSMVPSDLYLTATDAPVRVDAVVADVVLGRVVVACAVVGTAVVGVGVVGRTDGAVVGRAVGAVVGRAVVGRAVGAVVGHAVGAVVGCAVGVVVGPSVGAVVVGTVVGCVVTGCDGHEHTHVLTHTYLHAHGGNVNTSVVVRVVSAVVDVGTVSVEITTDVAPTVVSTAAAGWVVNSAPT
jgi:hypothetical protein